jgi:hypothetical protein
MPKVTAVHLVFDRENDPQGFAKRHVGRQLAKGVAQSEVVREAWLHRHDPIPNAVTSTAFRAPPFIPVEIYYDPEVVGDASEEEVANALAKAGRR